MRSAGSSGTAAARSSPARSPPRSRSSCSSCTSGRIARASTRASVPRRVLIAQKLIPRGTSGTLIARQGLYLRTTVQKDELKVNAIQDPAALNDRVAAADIFPGQQLTQDDFRHGVAQLGPVPDHRPAARNRRPRRRRPRPDRPGERRELGRRLRQRRGRRAVGDRRRRGGTLVTLLEPQVYVLVAPGAGLARRGAPRQQQGRLQVRVRRRLRAPLPGVAPAGRRDAYTQVNGYAGHTSGGSEVRK